MEENKTNKSSQQIAGAIIIAGIIVAGAILLKGNVAPTASNDQFANITIAKISENDRTLGNAKAKVALIVYEDFQCPFCGAVFGSDSSLNLINSLKQRDPSWTPFVPGVMDEYVEKGKVQFVYRDWAFLGPESIRAAEAARCAGDQGKFWDYHDYLYNNQNGENEGHFSDDKLKSFAKIVNLDTSNFNKCLDGNKHAQAVADSRTEGTKAGVSGTPKGFILKNGKIVAIIDGAEPYSAVKAKLESALK